MEQKKDTNLPSRVEAADRDADLQKFADFLSEMIARHAVLWKREEKVSFCYCFMPCKRTFAFY